MKAPSQVVVSTERETVTCERLVVCAGLQADRVAELAGLDIDVQIVPFRGEYYRLPDTRAGFVERLIYPVPDPELPFLGVHLSPTINGDITVGPSAVLGLAREGYPKFSVNARDVARMAAFPGLWRVAANNVGVGLHEIRNSLSKGSYLRECRKYAPTLQKADLLPYEAGIRAQAVRNDGTLIHDFVIAETARMLHVLNSPSPAATAALPIGQHLAEQGGQPLTRGPRRRRRRSGCGRVPAAAEPCSRRAFAVPTSGRPAAPGSPSAVALPYNASRRSGDQNVVRAGHVAADHERRRG